MRAWLIFILQKNKCTFIIPVATTFAKYHIPFICADCRSRTYDSIFNRDLPYLLAKFANYPFELWGLPLDIYLFWRQPIHHNSTIVSNWNLAYIILICYCKHKSSFLFRVKTSFIYLYSNSLCYQIFYHITTNQLLNFFSLRMDSPSTYWPYPQELSRWT